MSDLINLTIGGVIILLTGVAALAGVWVGQTGNSVGIAVITASMIGVGFLVVALGIQIPSSLRTG
jgi:hypothetical protein